MKVVDNRAFGYEQGEDSVGGRSGRLTRRDFGEEHDARGLVVAIFLCLTCWVALGFFLLS
jgi:hypothetical protein